MLCNPPIDVTPLNHTMNKRKGLPSLKMANFVKKTWRVEDVYRSDNGVMLASILKITHPYRHQRVTIVTTPRYATEQYYSDWVYQPYAKDHQLHVCTDIYVPTSVFVGRILLKRGKFPEYKYFTPMNLPDSVDLNISRKDYFQREKPIKCPLLQMSMLLNIMRDKRHRWLVRRVKVLLGAKYMNHPREEEESYVLMMPPHYVATTLNTLQGLGFEVQDRVEAPCGEEEPLKKLAAYSDIGQFAALSYIWMLLMIFIFNEAKRTMNAFEEYKREMIRKAGRDPSEFGM